MKLGTGLLVAGLTALATASIAQGVTINETAMVDIGNGIYSLTAFTDDPPLRNQIALGFGNEGRSYQNAVTLPGGSLIGAELHTVVASRYLLGVRRTAGPNGTIDGRIAGSDDGFVNHNGIRYDDPATNGVVETIDALLISGVRLRVRSVFDATTAVADVIGGRAGIFTDPDDNFNPDDPSTWDVSGTPAEIDALALGLFNLAPKGMITSGPLGANVGTLPEDVSNITSLRSGIGTNTKSILVFEEDESVTDLFTNNNRRINTVGEGLLFFTTEEQETPTAQLIWDGTDEAILNDLMQWAIGQDFASFSGNPLDLTDYQPDLAGPQAGIDAQRRLDINGNPTARRFAVPEPITAALSALSLGVLGMATRRRVA